jgi:DNA polymerase (family X)
MKENREEKTKVKTVVRKQKYVLSGGAFFFLSNCDIINYIFYPPFLMLNQEIANILYEIGYFLEIEEAPFKPQAYEKAAIVLETLEENIRDIYGKGGVKGLEKIPGIGRSIAKKIEEYLQTGEIRYYQELKKKIPIDIGGLMQVEGVGAKTIKKLYQELNIGTIKDLERVAQDHKIASLPGFGVKKEQNIIESIKFLKKGQERILLDKALFLAKEIERELLKFKGVRQISAAGSLRRRQETVGDLDFLATADCPEKVMERFVNLERVTKVWGKGETKSSVRLDLGIDVDLRIVPIKSYGAALQYFTGSKTHNIALRKIAIKKGFKLSEYGLFRKAKSKKNALHQNKHSGERPKVKSKEPKVYRWVYAGGKTEEEVYGFLGMDYIEPELRENTGEIKMSTKRKLPRLIVVKDIQGDLHCHSSWNGGDNNIEEMAQEAVKLGYQYIGITDHTKFLRIENGLDEKDLEKQRKEINKINLQFITNNLQCRVLQGCEANILKDGRIDIKDEALKELDYAIAGIHSNFKMSKEQMTKRIIRAMKNPYIKIISHPTGRILKKRDEYQIDFNKILRVAKETSTILEVNACPVRLDLNDINIKRAKEAGVKMVINSDAHQKEKLRFINFGVMQARRGWAEKSDIINTQPLEKLLKNFRERNK